MKAELRLRPHNILPDAQVIEVWYGGEFLATVVGADGPGVNVVTKHRLVTDERPAMIAAGEMRFSVVTVEIVR